MAGTISMGGLASGLDTTSIIQQLMQIEANPQTLLKNQLTSVQADAAAYRDVNSSFAALASTAAALTGTGGIASARTATSSSTAVAASAGATAVSGSGVTFTVDKLASAQTSISTATWSSRSADVRTQSPGWPLTVLDENGASVGTIDVPAGGTLADAATAINTSSYGLSATIVQLAPVKFKLQVSSTATGAAGAFKLQAPGEDATTAGSAFTTTATASDAEITLTGGLKATSASNTFSELTTGLSVTVSAVSATPTTITVGTDNKAITDKVQALVTAANNVLAKVSKYTDTSTGSTAVLKGDFSLSQLTSQVLQTVSSAVGTSGSTAQVGLQLTRDGQLTFDSTKFQTALTADPALVQRLLGGEVSKGTNAMPGDYDDTVSVDGVAARLQVLAQRASDSTNGTLALLAKSQDTRASDLTQQIADWDDRLAQREATLTAKFTAMETALSTLKGQSDWLSTQLDSLSGSSSKKS